MIGGFFDSLREVVEPLGAKSVLDAGCGEGETIARLQDLLPERVSAVDILPESVEYTRRRLPSVDAAVASLYELPFADDSFDLVLCLEVLEHLDRPQEGLAELARVSRREVVVSVPFEPYFRIGSLLRGNHLRRLGNHPEHVNQWNRRTLAAFLGSVLEVEEIGVAFPWLIAHCRAR